MLMLALHLHALRIRHVHIAIARVISPRPADELVPILTLPGLVRVIAVAEVFGREFEPGGVVGVAVDVLEEAVEAVLDVVVEVVVFLRDAAVRRGGEFLDFDLGACKLGG